MSKAKNVIIGFVVASMLATSIAGEVCARAAVGVRALLDALHNRHETVATLEPGAGTQSSEDAAREAREAGRVILADLTASELARVHVAELRAQAAEQAQAIRAILARVEQAEQTEQAEQAEQARTSYAEHVASVARAMGRR